MKKIPHLSLFAISAISLLSLSTTGFAAANYKGEVAPCPCPTGIVLNDGFYVGAAVGYDSYRIGKDTNITDSDGDNLISSRNLSRNGWVGGLFLGYGKYFCNRYYLGGEIFGNGTNASGSYSALATTTAPGVANQTVGNNGTISINHEYGISLLPGIKINNDLLFYVRLGYNWARFKINESITSSVNNVTSTSKTSTQGGFNYGLGMEGAISCNVSLRGEFTHTNYSSFTSSFGTKYSPSDNQFMLGLIYHFA